MLVLMESLTHGRQKCRRGMASPKPGDETCLLLATKISAAGSRRLGGTKPHRCDRDGNVWGNCHRSDRPAFPLALRMFVHFHNTAFQGKLNQLAENCGSLSIQARRPDR